MTSEGEVASAFEIARQALAMMHQFQTPPTPEVYEVWYHYVQGSNEPLCEQLRYAVEDAKTVDLDLMRAMHQQYFSKRTEKDANISGSLAGELVRIHSAVSDQMVAGTEFAGSLREADEVLSQPDGDEVSIAACVKELAGDTKKMQGQLETLRGKLEASEQRVAALKEDLRASQHGMMTDHLTGIGNRRFFDTLLRQAVEHRDESNGIVYLAVIDIDRFKDINDTFGHDAGDQLIRFIADQIAQVHPEASLARLGGDEFAAVARVQSRDDVVAMTDTLREHFLSQNLQLRGTDKRVGKITMSIGAAKLKPSDNEATWYQRADGLLYQAKDLGRDRAVIEKG